MVRVNSVDTRETIMRTASRLFAILALSFVAIAALEIYFAVPTAPPPPWTVDNTEFVLGDVPSGKRVVTVHGLGRM